MSLPRERFVFSQPALGGLRWGVGAGMAALLAGLMVDPGSTWTHVFMMGYFLLQVGLGATVLMAILSVTGAGWGTAVRRIPEALAALIPVGGAMVLLALFAWPGLHPWTSEAHAVHGGFKHAWLSRPFFLCRALAYVALWTCLSRAIVAASRRQDIDGALVHTRRFSALSAGFLVAFGLSYSLASFDWVMSREPEWASTMFGVYQFAGLFTAALAAILVAAVRLWRDGPMRGVFSDAHQHDLGKLLFGMTSFWMYIWYCQYMLIWYVNIPEETAHYLVRQEGALHALFWVNVLLNWAIPFLFLLPRAAKSKRKILLNVSIVVLLGHWLDLALALLPPRPGLGGAVCAAGITLGTVALGVLAFGRALGQASLVPARDPYLSESLPGVHGVHGSREEV